MIIEAAKTRWESGKWVRDWMHPAYEYTADDITYTAPDDGSAWEFPVGIYRIMRGGGINSDSGYRSRNRVFHEPNFYYGGMGFRCVR